MAFDNPTRNRLNSFVAVCRNTLTEEFTSQLKRDYGMDPDSGVVTDIEKLTQLDDARRETARILRDTLQHYVAGSTSEAKKARQEAMRRIIREQAFTVLNRLCALRMAEARKLFVESVGNGLQSQGFQLYARLAGTALGESSDAYRCYLFSVFDELAVDLAVVFNRFSPEGRLFPSGTVLQDILSKLNAPEMVPLWEEDETIGWIYQYFNDPAERKKMRDESAAPRNSRELAVRNQFFTPRYVVEFLTDNTLGRIWYEMTQGQTSLKESCRYMVRRPDEVFLSEGSTEPLSSPSRSLGIPARAPSSSPIETIKSPAKKSAKAAAAAKAEEGTGRNAHPTTVAELLLTGTDETFPEFSADSDAQIQQMIEFAHGVDGYIRHANEEGSWQWLEELKRQHLEPNLYDGVSTQEILDALFLTCRNDRHGGDGTVYKDRWFAAACNEVRRRVLNSRRTDLSQEELLKQPVFIPYRAMKDPREIRMLDPACGSMHFGLYAFDLFEQIYLEFWQLSDPDDESSLLPRVGGEGGRRPDEGAFVQLRETFDSDRSFQSAVPKLIIEHNIHGIDIDRRATQIAGLSLWLRAQKSWQKQKVKPQDRPRIVRSNIVCAEPMPGNSDLLEEFLQKHLSSDAEGQLLTVLVRKVFEAMKLAGEAGSLLKIEEEIAGEVEKARLVWDKSREKKQQSLFDNRPKQVQQEMDFVRKIDDATFWDEAENLIYAALRAYAEQAENGGGLQRRLFAEDAARGFAFIDICKKLYDVALMNPPFGDTSLPSKPYLDETYGDTKGDVYKAFVECFHARLVPAGYLGIISSRTGFFLSQSEDWRTRVVLRLFRPITLADLGIGVLDAMVEVAAYVLRSLSAPEARDLTHSIVPMLEKVMRDSQDRFSLPKWQAARDGLKRHQAVAELKHLEAQGFVQRSPGDTVRYSSLWHSVKMVSAPPEPVFPALVCVRALAEMDKGAAIAEVIARSSDGRKFVCNPNHFKRVPGNPFAYWASPKAVNAFTRLPALKDAGFEAWVGLQTNGDFRWLRAWWEVNESHTPAADNQGETRCWLPFAKGGEFAPVYCDIPLVVLWGGDGHLIKVWKKEQVRQGLITENNSQCWNESRYKRIGLTWPSRTNGLSFRAMPAGCIFGHKGPAVFSEKDASNDLLAVLGILNSAAFVQMLGLMLARVSLAQSFEVGLIRAVPLPPFTEYLRERLLAGVHQIFAIRYKLDTTSVTSHAFQKPSLLTVPGSTLAARAAAWGARVRTSEETVAAIQAEIDDLAFRLYGIDDAESAALTSSLANETTADAEAETGEDEEVEAATVDGTALSAELLGYSFGVAFGRWDIRYATGERVAPELPDPFAPLPVCPPGQLQNAEVLPARPEDVSQNYAIQIPWDGFLVDDPGHALDIERRVREVIEIIWGRKVASGEERVASEGKERGAAADSAPATPEAIEQEACEILGVRSLREYFQKPAKFFADHLRRYSKSRRQAPIYWPLSTESGGYTLWIYYHRLTDQTLFHAVNNFVEPKLKQVTEQLSRLKAKSGRSPAEEKELSTLTVLEGELTDFRDELLRVAKFWKPNLNDGVLITASPLWKLFRLPKWRKDLKACWDELDNGAYDWAHLALSIWPDRVVRTTHKDRSIAIAHDLESDLWHEVTVTKPGRGKNAKPTTKIEWQPKKLSEAELEKIVQQVKQRPYSAS
jgi:hypothetical protein